MKQQDKQRLILFAVIGIIVLALDYQFLAALSRKGKAMNKKIVALKNNINTFGKDFSKMRELKAKQAQTKEFLIPRIKKILPEEQKVSLLQDISDIANKNNVKILQMNPVSDPKQEKPFLGGKIAPLYITLDLICDYHSLGRFVNGLENAETLMSVQDLKITKDSGDFLKEKITMVVRAYVKK